MRNILLLSILTLVLAIAGCKKDETASCDDTMSPSGGGETVNDTTYLDTLTQYFDRSADFVYHTANNPSQPDNYQRYFYGTNENYTNVAQHFDFPLAQNTDYTVNKVEIFGFRVHLSSGTQSVGSWDELTYHIYASDDSYYPVGESLYTGTFLPSSGPNGSSINVIFNEEDLSGVEINGANGFLIDFETYSPGSDIFVMNNSWCVVPNQPNDGRAERRTKVKLTSNGEWSDIITEGPAFNQDSNEDQLMLDCDAYVFPYMRVTEVE